MTAQVADHSCLQGLACVDLWKEEIVVPTAAAAPRHGLSSRLANFYVQSNKHVQIRSTPYYY